MILLGSLFIIKALKKIIQQINNLKETYFKYNNNNYILLVLL